MTFPEFLSYAITAIVLSFLLGLVMLPLALTWRIWVITRERIHSCDMQSLDKQIELEKAKAAAASPAPACERTEEVASDEPKPPA